MSHLPINKNAYKIIHSSSFFASTYKTLIMVFAFNQKTQQIGIRGVKGIICRMKEIYEKQNLLLLMLRNGGKQRICSLSMHISYELLIVQSHMSPSTKHGAFSRTGAWFFSLFLLRECYSRNTYIADVQVTCFFSPTFFPSISLISLQQNILKMVWQISLHIFDNSKSYGQKIVPVIIEYIIIEYVLKMVASNYIKFGQICLLDLNNHQYIN